MTENDPVIQHLDNPVENIFSKVLGHNFKPNSVKALLDAAAPGLDRNPSLVFTYMNIADKNRISASIGGMRRFSGQEGAAQLSGLLKKRGLLSRDMATALSGLAGIQGNEFFYDASQRALFYGSSSSGRFSALPIQGVKTDIVTFGRTNRAVNLLGQVGSGGINNFTFADAYYTSLAERIGQGDVAASNVNRIIDKDILKAKVSQIGQPVVDKITKGKLRADVPVVVFDLETAGLGSDTEILQLAATRIEKDGTRTTLNKFFMPSGNISAEATAVHGYTKANLVQKGATLPFEAMAKDVNDFFKGAIVAGYNIKGFDIDVLNNSLKRGGVNANISASGVIDVLDLYKNVVMSRKTHLGKSLTAAFKTFTGQSARGHDALVDITNTESLMEHIIGTYHPEGTLDASKIALAMKHGMPLGLRDAGGPSLKSVLQGGKYLRGRDISISARMTGLKQLVTGRGTDIENLISDYRDARSALTMMTKNSGVLYGDLANSRIFTGLSQGFGYKEALPRINKAFNDFYAGMPAQFQNLGIGGLWPLSKAEFLLDKSNLVLPTKLAGKVFGTVFDEGFYGKGMHQQYKLGATTAEQVRSIMGMKGMAAPAWMTEAQYDLSGEYRRLGVSMRVGVAELNGPTGYIHNSRLLFGDSGGILSNHGARKYLTPLPTGRITINSPSEGIISAVEQVFGVNLAGGNQHNLNKKLEFTSKDIRRLLKTTDGATLTDKEKALRELLGRTFMQRSAWFSMVHTKSRLASIEHKEGVLSLQFMSSGLETTPGALEVISGARRFTYSKMLPKSQRGNILNQWMSKNKIDVLISHEDFMKMHSQQVYLDNFFSILHRENMMSEAASMLIRDPRTGRLKGVVRMPGQSTRSMIPLVTDHESAYNAAMNIMKNMQTSGDAHKVRVAEEIEHGHRVTADVVGLEKMGITGARIFNIQGALRTDFMADINIMKSVRLTPGKMRTLALGSKLLGYESPYQDPVAAAMLKGWAGRGISINPSTLDFMLDETHLAKQFARAASGNPITPNEAHVVKVSQDGLSIGGRKLKSLPTDMKGFRQRTGGMSFEDLADTILDRGLGKGAGILYLDMGEGRITPSLLEGNYGVTRGRYIPLPMKYIRSERGVGGRLVLSKNHPGYNYVKALQILEANPEVLLKDAGHLTGKSAELRHEFFDLLQKGTTNTVLKLAGRDGLFNKTNTLLVPGSFRARLISNRSGSVGLTNSFDIDKIFEVEIGQSELEHALKMRYGLDRKLSKTGGYDFKTFRSTVKKSIEERGFTYAMIGADPANRPEHLQLVKLKVVEDAKREAKFGQVNLQAHPLMQYMMRRDNDRDAITLHFIEGLLGKDSRFGAKELEEALSKRKKALGMFKYYHLAGMQQETAKLALGATPWSTKKVISSLGDRFASFVSQKSFAHLGFSITRPVNAFMHGLSAGVNPEEFGMKMDNKIIEQVVAPFKGKPMRAAVAETIAESLFQGGIQKGSKSGLVDLAQELINISQGAKETYNKTGKFAYDDVIAKSTTAFRTYLSDVKNAGFMATKFLLEDAGVKNIDHVERDLIRGMQTNFASMPKTFEDIMGKTLDAQATLLAQWYGAGHAMSAVMGHQVHNISGMLSGTAATAIGAVASKILVPLGATVQTSDTAGKRTVIGELTAAAKAAKSVNAESIFNSIKKFFDQPGTAKAALLGAVAGALGYAAFAHTTQAPLPPQMDNSQPSDMGPMVSYKRAKIYSGSNRSVKVGGNPALIGDATRFNGRSQNNDFSVRDSTQPFNPQIAQAQMDRMSRADFVA